MGWSYWYGWRFGIRWIPGTVFSLNFGAAFFWFGHQCRLDFAVVQFLKSPGHCRGGMFDFLTRAYSGPF
ncbi:hypothetical protein VTJ04DRAFT_4995 [Mycothermus thermophilus]|uniref:uncharacterized protein n=1 Tax=Humicola insolens TaxID=85995 RepID=UPI003743A0A4